MRMPSAAAVEMIKRLVAFDTTSRDSNLALIDYVQDYLAALGVESRLVFDASGKKANLFATLGPGDRPGIVLSGHTDVVPVDGQDWATDPFAVVEKDGRLYGRGTCDMKSFVAVALSMAPDIVARRLPTPIHFAFSYDEEIGCVGVRGLLADLAERGVRPLACIIGEPTEMKVIRSHKGKLSLRCQVRGFECHSSLTTKGVNAVEIAAELVTKLRAIGRRLRAQGPYDDAFDPPFTTVHTGVIQGGTALNIVPKACWFDFEFRHLPADDPRTLLAEVQGYAERELLPEMRAVASDAGFTWTELSQFPGLDTPEDAEVTALVKSTSGSNATGKVAFGTEAGLYQASGIPTIVCGPGSIEQAHKPNEFIALEQVALCEAFLARVLEKAAAAQ